MADYTMIRERFLALSSHLDERSRRIFAATEARTAGHGGIAAASRATGVAASTIGRGLAELSATDQLARNRVRRPGGGDKRLVDKDPTLLADLLALVDRTRAAIRCHHCAGPAKVCRNCLVSSDIRNPAVVDIENPATPVTLMLRPGPMRLWI